MTTLGYSAEPPIYTATARVLHWLTAVLVLTMIPIGLVMANFSLGPTGDVLYDIHRSFGAVLIPIILVRLAYRLAHPPPPLPDDIPTPQRLWTIDDLGGWSAVDPALFDKENGTITNIYKQATG